MNVQEKGGQAPYWMEKQEGEKRQKGGLRDVTVCLGVLVLVTVLNWGFYLLGLSDANIITVYLLGVVAVSVMTARRAYSLAASVASVAAFNFFFTAPRFTLWAYDKEDVVTFLVMLAAGVITCSLAEKLKDHVKESELAAFRMKILFETSRLLITAGSRREIARAVAGQTMKMLNRSVAVFLAEEDGLDDPMVFSIGGEWKPDKKVAERAFLWGRSGDFFQDFGSGAKDTYIAIRVHFSVYGVMAIRTQDQALDDFESGILQSLLGECALALENEKNAREKKEAAVEAENERLRSNLLRSISHDLRTPLTSISGNASNLLNSGDSFDEETRRELYADIYEDSVWLIRTVENLLAVTRVEQGKTGLHMSAELLEDVVEESMRHVSRTGSGHEISVEYGEEFLMARMDARLIVQVLVNLLDNAVKYTPEGSHIRISVRREGEFVRVSVADDGSGIPDGQKQRVFDMFYTAGAMGGDSRRSTGLGLYLCRAIVKAHGGEISLKDNAPHGSVFTFTLPGEEVTLHE